MPYYTRHCDFPFEDAGKECGNSNQCKGKCVVNLEEIKRFCPVEQIMGSFNSFKCEGVKGKCSQYPLRMCDIFYELNDNIVTANFVLCD